MALIRCSRRANLLCFYVLFENAGFREVCSVPDFSEIDPSHTFAITLICWLVFWKKKKEKKANGTSMKPWFLRAFHYFNHKVWNNPPQNNCSSNVQLHDIICSNQCHETFSFFIVSEQVCDHCVFTAHKSKCALCACLAFHMLLILNFALQMLVHPR